MPGQGATEVIGVEMQTSALAAARENAKRNQLTARWVEQDVFLYLRAAEKAGAQFDLIILDPPSFTKTKSGIRDAIRGYRELHLRAFKLLSRDGILATFSCSHHITRCNFIRNNFGGTGGRAPIGATAATFRTSARSPSCADHAGDGIFQGRVVGNEAVDLKSEPDCM